MAANPEISSILFVTGYRASGKSKIGELLRESYGYAIYDAGPVLRSHAKLYGELGISAEEHIRRQRALTGDPAWELNFDVDNVAALLASAGKVAIIGYRNYDEARYVSRELAAANEAIPEEPTILHVSCEPQHALERYAAREGYTENTAAEKLSKQYELEEAWGVPELRQCATFMIENDGMVSDLHMQVARAMIRLSLMDIA